MKSAAKIRFDVEVNEARAKIKQLSGSVDKLNKKIASGAGDAGAQEKKIDGWQSGIARATGALIKYRAVMFGIETVTDAVRKSFEKIENRANTAAERQLGVEGGRVAISRVYGSGEKGLTKEEVYRMVDQANVEDRGELGRNVATAISTRDQATSIRDAAKAAIAVAESSWFQQRQGNESDMTSLVTGSIALADLKIKQLRENGSDTSGIDYDKLAVAQAGQMERFVAAAPGRDAEAVRTNLFRGVTSLMSQGVDQRAAMSAAAALATQAKDKEGNQTATMIAKSVAKGQEVWMKMASGMTNKMSNDQMARAMYGMPGANLTEAQKAMMPEFRRSLLGMMHQSDDELNRFARDHGFIGGWSPEVEKYIKREKIKLTPELSGRSSVLQQNIEMAKGAGNKQVNESLLATYGMFGDLNSAAGVAGSRADYMRGQSELSESAPQAWYAHKRRLAEEGMHLKNTAGLTTSFWAAGRKEIDAYETEGQGWANATGHAVGDWVNWTARGIGRMSTRQNPVEARKLEAATRLIQTTSSEEEFRKRMEETGLFTQTELDRWTQNKRAFDGMRSYYTPSLRNPGGGGSMFGGSVLSGGMAAADATQAPRQHSPYDPGRPEVVDVNVVNDPEATQRPSPPPAVPGQGDDGR